MTADTCLLDRNRKPPDELCHFDQPPVVVLGNDVSQTRQTFVIAYHWRRPFRGHRCELGRSKKAADGHDWHLADLAMSKQAEVMPWNVAVQGKRPICRAMSRKCVPHGQRPTQAFVREISVGGGSLRHGTGLRHHDLLGVDR